MGLRSSRTQSTFMHLFVVRRTQIKKPNFYGFALDAELMLS